MEGGRVGDKRRARGVGVGPGRWARTGGATAAVRAAVLAVACRQPPPAASRQAAAGRIRASPTWATVAEVPSTRPAAAARRQPGRARRGGPAAGGPKRDARPAPVRAAHKGAGMIGFLNFRW